MHPELDNLIAQRDELTRKIDAIQAEQRAALLAQARDALAALGVSAADLVPARVSRKASRKSAVAIRYRGPGGTWTGRGKQPVWLRDAISAGATLGDFLVAA
jgi:DNA-binding protein H-NS